MPTVHYQRGSRDLNPVRLISTFYRWRRSRQMRTLLRGITLAVKEGDRVGLIGRNGAGKTTLLHVLAGTYVPTAGELEINGRVQTLFNVSVGFRDDATGLENIYLRALVIGIPVKEIADYVDEIIAFSEIPEQRLFEPIRTYSVGMKLRLAFSTATIMRPEILLLDEWIGVGDAGFVEKAQRRLREIVQNSRGLVIASHRDNLLREVCDQGIVLENGEMIFQGGIEDALQHYKKEILPTVLSENKNSVSTRPKPSKTKS